jgi:phytol kinase
MLNNNLLALALTLAVALSWLRINNYLATKGWVSSGISRKIIHIGTGPIFVLCWLFFNDLMNARYLAAIVPLGITLQFALVGSGVIRDPSAVEAMSRSGDRREILRGPLFYGIAFVILTIIFWRHSPIGIVALMILCGGDGLADIVGKRVNSRRLFWSPKKTLAGSLTMLVGGFTLSVLVLWIFISLGYFKPPISNYIFPIAMIVVVASLIESLPFADVDNITVPLVSVIMGFLLF